MSHMSLVHLRVFCEVADCMSVTQAAARLHRTQPAISRQLAELEGELGVKLFHRRGRQLSLTPAGDELLLQSRAVLGNASDLVQRAHELAAGSAAVLRVGATSTSMEKFIPPLLRAFREIRPNIGVRVSEADARDLAVLVETGQLDLAFAREVASDPLSSVRLYPQHLVAVVPSSHRLASRTTLQALDLEREPLLLGYPGSASRVLLTRACQADGLTLRDIRIESRAYLGLAALAEAGCGIAVTMASVVSVRPGIRILPVIHRGKQLGSWFSAIRHRNQADSVDADALVKMAQEQVRNQYPGQEFRFGG
jgi:DNA-binding transcriptional LysR family regulator